MAPTRAPSWPLILLGVAALAAFVARLIPGRAGIVAWVADGSWVLGAAFLGALAATALLRAASAALARRGTIGAARMTRPFETLVALAAILVATAALTGNLGGALVSLGLLGFGFTLALQRPILALAGWASIQVGRLFRPGDRIEIDGIVGDVLDVRLFTTRLWEIASSNSPLASEANRGGGRPTGRIVTLSNAVFLERPLANATSDISHVFDEFSVSVAYEADLPLARRILMECATQVLDPDAHARAAAQYSALTRGMSIEANFPREPVVLESLKDSWVELRLRYLVDARRRADTRTKLARAWLDASLKHPAELPNVYPRIQPQAVGRDGRP